MTVNKTQRLELPMLGIESIKEEFLNVAKFDSPEQLIEMATDEFSAMCPFTGMPDYASIAIRYFPKGGLIVELLSLKQYLTTFRPVGIAQEQATKVVHRALTKLLKTEVQITTIYNTREGIDVTCTEGDITKQEAE